MPMDQFWSMTWAEFHEKSRGFIKSRRDRINEQLYVAFRSAWLSQQREAVSLEDFLLPDENKPQEKVMTPEQIMAQCRLINAAMGGTEVIV